VCVGFACVICVCLMYVCVVVVVWVPFCENVDGGVAIAGVDRGKRTLGFCRV